MKVCVIQPPYSYDERDMSANFDKILSLLDECDSSLDLIVLPEYSDVPADLKDNRDFFAAVRENGPRLMAKASEAAKRCSALVFVNAMHSVDGGKTYRNTMSSERNHGTFPHQAVKGGGVRQFNSVCSRVRRKSHTVHHNGEQRAFHALKAIAFY